MGKMLTMWSSIKCQCCREMENAVECITENKIYRCITDQEQFKIMSLNKNILHTALVMMNRVRGDPISLPLSNR